MRLDETFKFERDNARALMAAERDPKKRKALQERVTHYERQLRKVENHERATNE